MKKSFTHEDLVAFAYGEADDEQIQAAEAALSADPALVVELIHLVEAQAALPRVRFQPRRGIIDVILRYARRDSQAQLCY
jgi:anti-sigma factor RsiW